MSLTFSDYLTLVSMLSVCAWITYAIHECVQAVVSIYEENF
jgi:hypothetical protein